jgi:hypothetical protein
MTQRVRIGRGRGEGWVGVKSEMLGGKLVMHERIKRILKGKNEETEMENEGGGGVFRIRFSLEMKSEKRGGNTVPQFL